MKVWGLFRSHFAIVALVCTSTCTEVHAIETNPPLIRSKIIFNGPLHSPTIQYADISVADPLTACPLERYFPDLLTTVNQLVSKVRTSVSTLKASQGENCADLNSRLTSSQVQIGAALRNQFISSGRIVSQTDQVKINQQTQQAMAVNEFILTTSSLIQSQCIHNIDDRIVLQRLLGQVITLGGLFMGGWEGIAVAGSGQIVANLPIFTSDVDKSLETFQRYDEINERGSFLCLYRQMLKTSCYIFTSENHSVINGIDMTFETGPGRTTLDSLRKMENESPNEMADLRALQEIRYSTDDLMTTLEKLESYEVKVSETFHRVREWCAILKKDRLKASDRYPLNVGHSYNSIQNTCKDLDEFQWRAKSKDEFIAYLTDCYLNLLTLRTYFDRVSKESSTPLGKLAGTLESRKYFEGLKQTLDSYRDTFGNQFRINYEILVEKMGRLLAKKSFKSIMHNDYKMFRKHSYGIFKTPYYSDIRRRGVRAMLDLCQTLDPTLACLSFNNAKKNPLMKEWMSACVGHDSKLCRTPMTEEEMHEFFQKPEYQIYYNSLCGQ